MRLDNLNEWQKADVERRLAKGHGEVVTIKYTDLEEQTVPVYETQYIDSEEGTEVQIGAERKLVPVDAEVQVYVGKMSPGQTGTVINILGRVFFDGMKGDAAEEEAEAEEEKGVSFDLNAIVSVLDDQTMTHLFSVITGLDEPFVFENWDLEWAADVFAVFVRYNNFFKLVEKVTDIAVSITGTPMNRPSIQRVK